MPWGVPVVVVNGLLCFQSYKNETWTHAKCIKIDNDAQLSYWFVCLLHYVFTIRMFSTYLKIVYSKTINTSSSLIHSVFTVNLDHIKEISLKDAALFQ